jgi:hypothetical protein
MDHTILCAHFYSMGVYFIVYIDVAVVSLIRYTFTPFVATVTPFLPAVTPLAPKVRPCNRFVFCGVVPLTRQWVVFGGNYGSNYTW